MPQSFGILEDMMAESLDNSQPDAIRAKHQWPVIAECDVDGLHHGMKKCPCSRKQAGWRMKTWLGNALHCQTPGHSRTIRSRPGRVPLRSNGWNLLIGHDQNRGVGPNLNAFTQRSQPQWIRRWHDIVDGKRDATVC